MKGKFHINSKGEPGECSAVNGGCPFGEHYESIDAAEKAYEEAWGESHLRSLNKKTSEKKKDWSDVFENEEEVYEWKNLGFTPSEADEYSKLYEPYQAYFIKNSREEFFNYENMDNYVLIDSKTGVVLETKDVYVIDTGDLTDEEQKDFYKEPETFLNYTNLKILTLHSSKNIDDYKTPVLLDPDGTIVNAKNVYAVNVEEEGFSEESLYDFYEAIELAKNQGFSLWD